MADTPDPPLSAAELRLAADLLNLAAEEFANHGCNDYVLSNTDENWALLVACWERAGIPKEDQRTRPPAGERLYAEDWLLMRVLAKRLGAP